MRKNPVLTPTMRDTVPLYLTFAANELKVDSVIRKFRITAKNGKQDSEGKTWEVSL